jgi:hypothetical protein
MGIFTDKELVHQVKRCADALWELVNLERDELRQHVVGFTLAQLRGDEFMPISGTVVGTTSTFQISFVPATNFIPLPTPPTVSVDDTNVTLSAVDPTAFTFTATVASTDTAASYNLTVAGVNDQGTALTHSFSVPILPTPPPPPTSITDFDLNQLS